MYVGNDVIDLADPETRLDALRDQLMENAFDGAERDSIASDADPCAALWIRWAAKQSAVKALRKVDREAGFEERRYRVDFFNRVGGNRLTGTVEDDDHRFDVDVVHHGNTIHAVALLGRWPQRRRVVSDVIPIEAQGNGSTTAREALVSSVAGELEWSSSELRVTGSTPPRLEHRGAVAGIDVSLSHHGRLSAFAYMPPPRTVAVRRPTSLWLRSTD